MTARYINLHFALTLNGTGCMTSLVRELGKSNVSLAGITYSRLTGYDVTRVKDAVVIHSGDTQQINGFALVLRGPFRKSLVSWTPCSRILQARIAHRHGHLTVVVVYALTEMTSDSIKDSFYNQLSAIIQSTSPHDNLIVLGNLTAVAGSANLGTSGVVGAIRLGHAK